MPNQVEELMARACALARSAVAHGNHPFGALLVKDGQILIEAENEVVTTRDVTQHAETALVAKASTKLDEDTLAASTLVASTEPCIMCCGAIHWAGIRRIVFGVRAEQMVRIIDGEGQYRGIPCRDVFARINPDVEIRGPVLEDEGLRIHAEFWSRLLGR